MTTRRRRPSNAMELAIALMPTDALGSTATSSASAPISVANVARSRSTSPTQASQDDPSAFHESRKRRMAASTSIDNAPWEQLFT